MTAPRRRPRLALALALALAACGDSRDDTHESHGASTTAGTTDGASSTATTTTGGATTHETHGESTTDGATTHDHGATTDATTHDTHDTHATTGGGDAEAYCTCMLTHCHDHFHATWGEDHEAAEAMCVAFAEAQDAAAFACRMDKCEAAAEDLAACVDAIGEGACG